MNIEEIYEAMQNRHQIKYFDKDKIPDADTITTILQESLLFTPVFANVWHHKVDVYGPQYYDDKKLVCLQTIEDHDMREKFDRRKSGNLGIEELKQNLNYFESCIIDRDFKNTGYSNYDGYTFNTQVLAPYLLKFTYSHHKFNGKTKGDSEPINSNGSKNKAEHSAAMHSLCISLIAKHYGIDSGFCGCFILNDYNKNRIWYNDDHIIFFLGLGYQSDYDFEGKDSIHNINKIRPTLNDIFSFS